MNTNAMENAVITKVIEVPCRKAGLIISLFEFLLQQNFRYNEKKIRSPKVCCDRIFLYNKLYLTD
jgi:hypothetical protein